MIDLKQKFPFRRRKSVNKAFVTGKHKVDAWLVKPPTPVTGLNEMAPDKREEMVRLYGPISTGARQRPKRKRGPRI